MATDCPHTNSLYFAAASALLTADKTDVSAGGAVLVDQSSLTLLRTEVTRNGALAGGAGYVNKDSQVTVQARAPPPRPPLGTPRRSALRQFAPSICCAVFSERAHHNSAELHIRR